MKHVWLLACVLLLACEEQGPSAPEFPVPLIKGPAKGGNLPAFIVGTYVLESAQLNGPEFEVMVTAIPEVLVVYPPNSDITHFVRTIVFRGNGAVPYSASCPQSQQAIEFKSNGRTSFTCLDGSTNTIDMGFWKTTGAENDLLAWSILHGNEVIECEVVPYEVSTEGLTGFLVFPLPRNTLYPALEGGNHQQRKIKIVLRKV